jgi:hypothetical protein
MQPQDGSAAPAPPDAGSNDSAAPMTATADGDNMAIPSLAAAAAAEELPSLELSAEGGATAAAELDSAATVPPAADVPEGSAAASLQPDAEQPPSDDVDAARAVTMDDLPAAASDETAVQAATDTNMQSTTAAADLDATAHPAAEPTPAGVTTDQPKEASIAAMDAPAWVASEETTDEQTPAGGSGGDTGDLQTAEAPAAEDMASTMPEPAGAVPVWTTAAVRLSQ